MTSERKIEANRRNALRSTGPRTADGKTRAAQNARRHGLNLPACCDPAWSEEIRALARTIVGEDASSERFELACSIAGAQIDVVRTRNARRELLPAIVDEPESIMRVAAFDFYERRALARRKRAIRDFDESFCGNEATQRLMSLRGNEPNRQPGSACGNEAKTRPESSRGNEAKQQPEAVCGNEPNQQS